jgi:4-diphosphocytidyl-2-C-methyl-D-erythritol kinase
VITVRAPGKVNLCLFLGGRRGDGRHELVTVFEAVSLADELAISAHDRDEVVCEGVTGRNLVADAIEGLRRRGWTGPPLRVEIDKRLPIAGGMGGGSADAAALLRGAALLAPVDPIAMAEIARQLGADVPGQLVPELSLGTGAGDLIEPLAPLPAHALVVVPLPHALSTADVYREADRMCLARSTPDLEHCRGEVERAVRSGEPLPEQLLTNDLGPAAVSLCPPIDGALAAVERQTAEAVMVSGSGPTIFGVFWGTDADQRAAEAASALQSTYPAAMAAAPVAAEYGNPRIA